MVAATKSYLSIPYKMYLDDLVLDVTGLPDINASSFVQISGRSFQNFKAIEHWGAELQSVNSSPHARCLLRIPFKDAPPLHPAHFFENYKAIERWAHHVSTGECGCPCSPPSVPPNPNCTLHIPFKTFADDFMSGRIGYLETRAREFDNLKAIERWAARFASGECACACGGGCTNTEYEELIDSFNPYSWWKGNDSTSPLLDYGSGGNNAGVTGGGGGTTFQVPGPGGSECGLAVEMGGNHFNTNVTIGSTQHYACMVTLNADSLATDKSPMANWNGTGQMIYATTGGALRQYHNTGFDLMNFTPTVGTWFHLLWGWNGIHKKGWVSGVSKVNSATTTGPGAGTTLYLGTYDNRVISIWNGDYQHMAVFLDGAADGILTNVNAADLASLALSS